MALTINKPLFDRLRRDWPTHSGDHGSVGFVATLAAEVGISAQGVWNMRKKRGYNKTGAADETVKKVNKIMGRLANTRALAREKGKK